MKLERLYAITVYLLNHGRTPASVLAEHFEVSLRTIQRDIDSLCVAGIPVIAVNGSSGGYEISEHFEIDREFATADEYSLILTALRGLVTATNSQKAKHTLEKLSHASRPSPAADAHGILLDFSVLREGDSNILQLLQNAVAEKRAVCFTYTNNQNETRTHCVEPVAVLYRWYAWYLLAYSRVKDDYRTYKLVRMSHPEITGDTFRKEHPPADLILQKMDQTDTREYTDVLLLCQAAAKPRAIEYLKGKIVKEFSNGDVLLQTTVVEEEAFWFGALLSFGDQIKVIEPEKIRRRAVEAAEKIIALYQKE